MLEPALKQGNILIVDDEPANVRLLEIILESAGYVSVCGITDSRLALGKFIESAPDLVLLDLDMPEPNGFQVLEQLRSISSTSAVPVLVLTADSSKAAKHRALREGANDFLMKPFDELEVLLRISNLLQVRLQHATLNRAVQERTSDLNLAQLETVQRLAIAAEYRDDETGQHARRVGITSALLCKILGPSCTDFELMLRAAPLHDVGKIGIPDSILLKPGRLTPKEFSVMKRHTEIGAGILSGSSSKILQLAEEIARTHHERWDGTGYLGLGGKSIPISGRIVALADVFDALTHDRPYKSAYSVDDAVKMIVSQSGRQFDAGLVEAFLKLDHERLVGGSSAEFVTVGPGALRV